MLKTVYFNINVSKRIVLNRLGYRAGMEISENLERMIDDFIEEGSRLIEPRAVYDVLDIVPGYDGIYIYNRHLKEYFESRFLAKRFKGCKQAALFAVTIGRGIEERCGKLETAEGAILDAVGSVAADTAAGYVSRMIADKCGLNEAKRWSPGYNDWEPDEQEKIFRLIHPEKIGIKLTESFYMLPQKSVSAIAKVNK